MKKLLVLLSISVVLITGCSIKKLDDNNISKNVSILLSEKVNLHNVYFEGYEYYVPKSLRFDTKEEYNAVLNDKYNNKYYLFVDVISYYHEEKNNYEVDKNVHYSKRLDYNGKTGYLQINKVKGKFFIQFVYNYAKMEAYVSEDNLTDAINNMCCVLRTIKFNDKVLESLVGENVLSYKEEEFSLFKAKSSTNFLDVVSKYETDDYNKDLEDEKIELSLE
jgi:hypothetical protein